jgi:putative transcriptional regulator
VGIKINDIQINRKKPERGKLLVSEPFLEDPYFRRSVVILVEHNIHGTVGFILNKELDTNTDKLVPGMFLNNFPVYYGGPLEPETLHFIYRGKHEIPGAVPICKNVFWGGEFQLLVNMLDEGIIKDDEVRFFIGYSGWASKQLELEIAQLAWWVVCEKSDKRIFNTNIETMWSEIVKSLGKSFEHLAKPPEDPRWN